MSVSLIFGAHFESFVQACEHRDRSVTALWLGGDIQKLFQHHFADFFGTGLSERSGVKAVTKGTRFRDPF